MLLYKHCHISNAALTSDSEIEEALQALMSVHSDRLPPAHVLHCIINCDTHYSRAAVISIKLLHYF